MITRRINVRFAHLLPLLEREAAASGLPISTLVCRVVAKHYGKKPPLNLQGFAAVRDREKKKSRK